MEHVRGSDVLNHYWIFDNNLIVWYSKTTDFNTKGSNPSHRNHIEQVNVERSGVPKEERVRFDLRLDKFTSDKVERNKLELWGSEEKLKQFVSAELEGITKEESLQLPDHVRSLLERKDYEIMEPQE
jgi:hypothetical protein